MKITLLAFTLVALSHLSHAHVQPAGGAREATLTAGSRITITWDSSLVQSPVAIALWDGERRVTTPIHQAYNGVHAAYEWTIPDTMLSGQLYRFVIASASTPQTAQFSQSFVTIQHAIPRVSSIDRDRSEPQLSITPLPARDVLHVRWDAAEATRVDLTTLIGQPLRTWSCVGGSTRMDIDVAGIPSCMYMLVVHRADGTPISRSVLVQH